MVYINLKTAEMTIFQPRKVGVAKIAARFARHFVSSTPLNLKSWIRPCLLRYKKFCEKVANRSSHVQPVITTNICCSKVSFFLCSLSNTTVDRKKCFSRRMGVEKKWRWICAYRNRSCSSSK